LTLSKGEHIAFFPEGTTSRGDRLNFFYPALFQTAVDTGATVQPLAIRWHHADGRLNFDAAFIDDLTVVDSIMLMLRHRVLYAEVNPVRSARGCRRFAAGIGVSHARGDREKTRSQLSRRARAACRGKF
jgi:1-acyl-sn-glycerol-3-phosphate acyltransferase